MLTIVPKPVLPFNREKAIAVGAGKWYTLCREEPCRKCEAPPVAGHEGGAVKALLLVVGAFFASAAFARQIVVPTLPVSPFADTEVSTNVVIHGSRVALMCGTCGFISSWRGRPRTTLKSRLVVTRTRTASLTFRRSRLFTAGAAVATSSRTSAHGRGLKRPPLHRHCVESLTFSCIATSISCREALPRRVAGNRLLQLFPPRLLRHGFSGTNGTWCASSGAVRERCPSGYDVT